MLKKQPRLRIAGTAAVVLIDLSTLLRLLLLWLFYATYLDWGPARGALIRLWMFSEGHATGALSDVQSAWSWGNNADAFHWIMAFLAFPIVIVWFARLAFRTYALKPPLRISFLLALESWSALFVITVASLLNGPPWFKASFGFVLIIAYIRFVNWLIDKTGPPPPTDLPLKI